jgi:hypothetical protein
MIGRHSRPYDYPSPKGQGFADPLSGTLKGGLSFYSQEDKMTEPHQQPVRTEIEIVRQALEKGKYKRIRKLLRGMHPAKVASLLESLESGQRSAMWQQVDDDAEQKSPRACE